MLLAFAILSASAPTPQSAPDLVLVNAKVFTADPAHPYAEALALMQDARWGARADQFIPLRSILAAGIPLALASDSKNVDGTANPFLNMMLAVSYPRRPREAITREQALTAYTAGGAYAEREEAHKGRIMPGLAADLAVLSQDILTAPLEALPATTSLLTVVDGAIVHADGPFAALAAAVHP